MMRHYISAHIAPAALIALVVLAVIEGLSFIGVSHASTQLQVITDKKCYDRGSTVTLTIKGYGSVAIEVYGPNSSLIWIDQLNVSGTAVRRFVIPSNACEGTYYVYAALNGQTPSIVAEFLVKRPYFSIINYTHQVSGYSGSSVTINVTIYNSGADGYVNVRLLSSSGNFIANKTVLVPYNESRSIKLTTRLPSVSTKTTLQWIIQAFNVKYRTIDSSVNVTVVVTPLVTTKTKTMTKTTTTTFIPPPMTTTTTKTTRTTMTTTRTTMTTTRTHIVTTTTTIKPIRKVMVNLSRYMAPNGTVVKRVKMKLPSGGAVVIEPGTVVKLNGTVVKRITIVRISKAPPAPPTEIVAGPIYDLEPSGATLSKPIIIILPFNPALIPTGYKPLPAYYNERKHLWIPVEVVSINYRNRTVTAKITHLSLYSVVAFKVYVVVTYKVRTLTKYLTVTSTSLALKTVSKTKVSSLTKVSILTKTTVSSLKPVTIVSVTTAPAKVVTKQVALTYTSLEYLTKTATRTVKTLIAQEGYVYAAFAVLAAALASLIVASVRGGARS